MDNQLAVSLSHLLEINKIDIKQLSEAINVSENRLNDIKEDLISSPTLTIVTRIANYFDVTIDYLIYGMPMVKDINNNDINWIPIEELTEELLANQKEILVFDEYSHVGAVMAEGFYGGVCIAIEDGVNDEYFGDIKKRYTHYALLTPPEAR